jgi:Mce-associated membrane protein
MSCAPRGDDPPQTPPDSRAAPRGTGRRSGRAADATRPLAWLALLLTTGFCAWALVSYLSAASDPALAAGRTRDAVLTAATAEIADLNSVSDRQIAAAQARWLADTTGVEHARIAASDASAKAQIQRVGTSSAATVTGAAVTTLNTDSGTAQVMAVVQVRETSNSGGSATITNRYLAVLTLTSQGWKISSMTSE